MGWGVPRYGGREESCCRGTGQRQRSGSGKLWGTVLLTDNGTQERRLREEHEAGLLTSMEFLKALLELAKDAVQLEKEDAGNEPEDPTARGKAALSKLFESVKNDSTPIIVERIVNDIDGIVRIVRFPGWQNTSTGRKEVSKNLRDVIMRKYRIKDQDVFSRAYSYVEQYY